MRRRLGVGKRRTDEANFAFLQAGCGVVSMMAAPQPPQKTSMEGSRANRSKATIEDLVRDIACPIQDLDGNATHLSVKCAQACVRAGSPIAILTKHGDLYLPISDFHIKDPNGFDLQISGKVMKSPVR